MNKPGKSSGKSNSISSPKSLASDREQSKGSKKLATSSLALLYYLIFGIKY